MSIRILERGMLDCFYDAGRFGSQYLGVNPGGVMDAFAMQVSNALVLNHPNEAVLEMHFPAAEILFEDNAVISLAGADFAPAINQEEINNLQPIIVKKGDILKFNKPLHGARTYLSVQGGFHLDNWLGSYSTNVLCKRGGYSGRALLPGDRIRFKTLNTVTPKNNQCENLPFLAKVSPVYSGNVIRIVPGRNFVELSDASQEAMVQTEFKIESDSNRMGYRLKSKPLQRKRDTSMLSTAVTMGTIQLLPNGQLIVLMADHQTIGGYPIIGNVIVADLPKLAQQNPANKIRFSLVDVTQAREALVVQQQHIRQLQNACNLRVKPYLQNVLC